MAPTRTPASALASTASMAWATRSLEVVVRPWEVAMRSSEVVAIADLDAGGEGGDSTVGAERCSA